MSQASGPIGQSPRAAGDLTVLTAWTDAVAEVLARRPARIEALFGEARDGGWRAELGLPEPSSQLGRALDAVRDLVASLAPPEAPPTFEAVLDAAEAERDGEDGPESVARRVLLAVLEQWLTREPAPSSQPSNRAQARSD